MIIRVFSPNGNKRITIDERENVNSLFDKIEREFINNNFQISRKRNGEEPIQRSSRHIATIGLKNGDIVYLQETKSIQKVTNDMDIDGDMNDNIKSTESSRDKITLQEDDIDKVLSKMDGRIYRQRNEQYCRHGPSGKCIHCVPLEPYDEEYLEHCDPPIQFISFHAYLRKLSGGQHQGKFTTLENINCKIKSGCKEHPPWPEGICTKCQPSAITLSVQKYRHVDNIMFENAALMNDFLDYWRKTGNQRIGILFGHYSTFDQAPLGIKAVVTAIYEPEQRSTSKSVELLGLQNAVGSSRGRGFLPDSVMEVAQSLGLVPVGWIFTDLVSEDAKAGTVRHYRGTMDTYFLTAQECVTAACLQNMYPNVCNLSADGYFGSKLVTVVATGDKDNQIHFEGYQVSNQCMALVRDDILVPTRDAPELGYVRESSSLRFVPDVFCKQKDKYGNSVTSQGRPLPVEFLLVHMTAAFPREETFSVTRKRSRHLARFPIENRQQAGESQGPAALLAYMAQFTDSQSGAREAVCDVHLLWYLAASPDPALMVLAGPLCRALAVREDVRASEAWAGLQAAVRGAGECTSAPNGEAHPDGRVWSCAHCTFHNDLAQASCQMCGLPV